MIKAQPGKLNYSTATGMTDVIFDGYFKSAGLAITRVPYRDVVAPLTDLGEGPHPGLCGGARDRAAACAGRPGQADRDHQQRSARPTLPDMPTVAQAGFPAHHLRRAHRAVRARRTWRGGTRPHRRRHPRGRSPNRRSRRGSTATGQLVSPGTAAEFAASIEEQRAKLAAIAQKLGIKRPAQ